MTKHKKVKAWGVVALEHRDFFRPGLDVHSTRESARSHARHSGGGAKVVRLEIRILPNRKAR